ncbi:hypothetical protein ES703_61580 [subsurface metagenome]
MPNNPTERIRRLLQTARQAVDTLSNALNSLEGELAALEQEAENQARWQGQEENMPETTLTNEEIERIKNKKLLTVKEAAFLMGLHWYTVYKLISKDKLPTCRLGPRTIRIPRKELEDYIDAKIRLQTDGSSPGAHP